MIQELAAIRVISKEHISSLPKAPGKCIENKTEVHNRATSIECKQILKDLRASPDKVIETGGFSTDQSNALHDELCKMLEANTYILEYGVTQFE